VRDTPISEQAILGAAMGAAMTGLKPIAEIMFSDFIAVCSGPHVRTRRGFHVASNDPTIVVNGSRAVPWAK
jgi:pyruvate/2-oxoglutarate/acetoin dehydrogenase E1 component